MKDPIGFKEEEEEEGEGLEDDVVRLSISNNNAATTTTTPPAQPAESKSPEQEVEPDGEAKTETEEIAPFLPEFRLVQRDDPEAYAFTTPQYSAHKLPREVVDASQAGPGGMKEFMGKWQEILEKRMQEDQEAGSDSE